MYNKYIYLLQKFYNIELWFYQYKEMSVISNVFLSFSPKP